MAGRCDNDGSELIQRPDDSAEAIARRLELYFDMTAPLLEYYRRRGLLTTVDGLQSIDDVEQAILDIVQSAVAEAV
jgi:adenylate kinase